MKRWAALESEAARILGGQRVRRDLFDKAQDVYLPDMPHWSIDAKAYRRFSLHTLMERTQAKYGGVPIVITKHHGQRGAYITLPLQELAGLLNELRRARNERRTA
jgi:hypothetical protein